MAYRLVRWLGERKAVGDSGPLSLSEAAALHLARRRICRLGQAQPEDRRSGERALERLYPAVRRCDHDPGTAGEQFARLLVDWTAAGSPAQEVLPVERILEEIVAPLAAEALVLVIVIDGLSAAVCRELLADLDAPRLGRPGRARPRRQSSRNRGHPLDDRVFSN